MSETSVQIATDLTKILERIDQRFDSFEQKLNKLSDNVNNLQIEAATIKTEINSINKCLDAQEFINRGVAIGILVALLGGLAKIFGFTGKI